MVGVLALPAKGQTKQKKTTFFVGHDVVSVSLNFLNSEDCTTGGNNGEIDISVSGGSGSYVFAWEKDGVPGFSTNEDLSGLSAGSYVVEVTDGICTTTQSFSVGYSCPYTCSAFNFSFTNIVDADCGNNNGEIEADVSGGEFTYRLIKFSRYSGTGVTVSSGTDTGPTTLIFPSLETGSYELAIEETVFGCTFSDFVVIGANDLSLAAGFVANSSCTTPNGELPVSVTNSSGPNNFIYKIKNQYTGVEIIRNSTLPNELFSGLVEGYYTIELTDVHDGCTIEEEGFLGNTSSLTVSLLGTTSQTNCTPPNGGADISISGGTGSYTIFWSNGATTEDLTNTLGGAYSVSVFDQSSRCTGFRNNIVIPTGVVLPNLGVSVADNTSCSAPYNGSINLTVSATPGPHLFEWRNEAGVVVSTIEDPANLAPGPYGVKVTNQPTGCSRNISVFDGVAVGDNSTPAISVIMNSMSNNTLCTDDPGNGAISVTVDAAGFPYSTVWTSSSGFTASNIEDIVNLPSGSYELTVEVVCSGSPPILSTTAPTLSFTGPDLVIDNSISVSDTDSPDLQSARVYFNSGYLPAEDMLVFVNQGGLSGSFDSGSGTLTITGTGSAGTYQTALRTVQYRNMANPRSKSLRIIGFEVSDGALTSNTLLRDILFPNQLPVLVGAPPSGLYGSGEYVVFPGAIPTDVDDANLASAQVSITAGLQVGSDELIVSPQPGITADFTSTTGILSLSGSSSLINYQNALRSVRFRNPNPAISPSNRQIQCFVQDGSGPSNAISTTLSINQAPAISTPAGPFSGSFVSIELTPLISDPNNNVDFTTLSISSSPQSGAIATLNGTTLSLDYSATEFSGTDQLELAVCDMLGLCTVQMLTIEIEGEFAIFNAVSANGDNLNAFFYLRNVKPGNRVTIFNRWGDIVYSVTDYDNLTRKFTGVSDSGKELPSGTYFYRIEMKNSPVLTGFLSLKR